MTADSEEQQIRDRHRTAPSTDTPEAQAMVMHLAMRGARMGMWVRDVTTNEVHWGRELEEIFSLPPGGFAGSQAAFHEYVHPQDLPMLERAIATAVAQRDDYVVEFRFRHASGEWRWMDGRGRAIYDEQGRPLRLYGVGIDITARKHAEQAAAEEARFLEVLNQVGQAVVAELDLARLVQKVTDAATELSGAEFGAFFYNVVDAQEKSYWLYTLSGADRSAFEVFPMPRATAVFKPTFDGTAVVRSDDITCDPRYGRNPPYNGMPKGHLPVRSYLAVPVASRSGTVLGGLFFGHHQPGMFDARAERLVVGIASQAAIAIDNARLYEAAQREIAARGQAEEALRAVASEREALLESEREARTEAERLSRLKDEFLATLSHELRTPLNAVLGWATLLRRPHLSPEDVARGAETIERNARAQGQIISDLLDMSAILAGKIHLEVQPVDLRSLITNAIESVTPSAQAKRIRLLSTLDAKLGLTRGDPSRLQQVLWNLMSNAVKFTPQGGRVHVVLERVNSHVELSIEDNGIGIKDEFLPYVFDRFRQADASTSRTHGGLGIGLSIVKNLVELHGGSVRVKSAGENQGATFIVALPMSAVHSEDTDRYRTLAEKSPEHADMPSLAGVTVLVTDDEADARMLIARLLEERGARVLLAASAQEGLALLAAEKIDLILSDIGMPEVDGYQFIRAVRTQAGKRIPAVALTAYARPEDRQRSLLAGYQMHIAKPVEALELIAGVASLLDLSGRQ